MAELVFWQNTPSIHQAPFIREVARRWVGRVITVAETDVSDSRRSQGWKRPDFGLAELLLVPDRERRNALIERSAAHECVHVFSGLRAYPETVWTMTQVARTPARMVVFLEPLAIHDGLRVPLRKVAYRYSALRWRKRLAFVLVTGTRGAKQYQNLGMPEELLFPFAYSVQSPVELGRQGGATTERGFGVRLLFVGKLVARKGVDLLLQALTRLSEHAWALDVVGDGPLRPQLQQMAETCGIQDRVRWRGNLENSEVRSLMAETDILVLPSRYDGWGAVVNEALAAGARALVSDACGSSDLLETRRHHGRVFRAGSVRSLEHALEEMLLEGRTTPESRREIVAWAEETISPRTLAAYFLEILASRKSRSRRPQAPWLSAEHAENRGLQG